MSSAPATIHCLRATNLADRTAMENNLFLMSYHVENRVSLDEKKLIYSEYLAVQRLQKTLPGSEESQENFSQHYENIVLKKFASLDA